MSKYRVGIIAEGPTDISVIEGIVKNIFPDDVFVFNAISPTPNELSMQQKDEGFGWGGVYRVCRNLAEKLRFAEGVSGTFDCVVIHIDADVAYAQYGDIGEKDPISDDLPCATLGDRCDKVCSSLERVLQSWVNVERHEITPCIPYICTEAWVGCWLYPEQWRDIEEVAAEGKVYKYLYELGLPKAEKDKRLMRQKGGRLIKCRKGYINAASILTKELWATVTANYKQAKLFDDRLRKVMTAEDVK